MSKSRSWVLTPCGDVVRCQRFWGLSCFHLQAFQDGRFKHFWYENDIDLTPKCETNKYEACKETGLFWTEVPLRSVRLIHLPVSKVLFCGVYILQEVIFSSTKHWLIDCRRLNEHFIHDIGSWLNLFCLSLHTKISSLESGQVTTSGLLLWRRTTLLTMSKNQVMYA